MVILIKLFFKKIYNNYWNIDLQVIRVGSAQYCLKNESCLDEVRD